MHVGTSPGASKDNNNAWKHGARSAEFVALTSSLVDGGKIGEARREQFACLTKENGGR